MFLKRASNICSICDLQGQGQHRSQVSDLPSSFLEEQEDEGPWKQGWYGPMI